MSNQDISKIVPDFFEEDMIDAPIFDVTVEDLEDFLKDVHDAPTVIIDTLPQVDIGFTKDLSQLGERQKKVYEFLKESFPNGATAKELSTAMFDERLVPSPERNSVHPRLNELIEKDFVTIVGTKKCQFTDRTVSIYKNK